MGAPWEEELTRSGVHRYTEFETLPLNMLQTPQCPRFDLFNQPKRRPHMSP